MTHACKEVRHPFHGALQILRFNGPFYAAAIAVGSTGLFAMLFVPGAIARAVIVVVVVPPILWAFASLAVSHYVYDRSEVSTLKWLAAACPGVPRSWLLLHAGLDEWSGRLRELFPASEGLVLDFYDRHEMSEASIDRARREQPASTRSRSVSWRSLPVDDGIHDAVFLIFAAHEFRREKSREQLFREIHRVLKESGRVILVEHLRDVPNFLAFGPGFLHFLPRSTWVRLARKTQLAIETEFTVTPFVRVVGMRKEKEG